MNFYRLTHPNYSSDHEFAHRNPVTSSTSHRLPGIVCSVCGAWSGSDRLRVAIPPGAESFTETRFLPIDEWKAAKDGWARMLGVAPDLIAPGAEFGPPCGSCSSPVMEDVVHPTPGEVWVVDKVRSAISASELTGISFARVILAQECGTVELWELVVHGRGWRRGSSEESIQLCGLCGRRGFPSPRNLSVDETRWDGSDFLFVDSNPNIVIVSQRAAEILTSSGFTNVVTERVGWSSDNSSRS